MATLNFQRYGSGTPVMLLHGFPFNQKIWNSYAPLLADQHTVYTPDAPGCGKSAILKPGFSIADVAEALLAFCADEKLESVALVGHSMGGYVALAMVAREPARFSSLTLFHSTAYADSDEKKASRNKVVEFVEKNGPQAFTTSFIPPLFVDQNHPAIEQVRSVAAEASEDAVIGYTKAMRDRPEMTKTLNKFENPTLFLAGEKDGGIPVDSIVAQARLCQKPENHILQGVAHMGMFEKPEQTATIIKRFLAKT